LLNPKNQGINSTEILIKMLNIEQFAYICAMNLAVDMATPGNVGPNFTWSDSFPRMALRHIETQWVLAARSKKVFKRALKDGTIQRQIGYVKERFTKLTGNS
jgi:hypothetical protein